MFWTFVHKLSEAQFIRAGDVNSNKKGNRFSEVFLFLVYTRSETKQFFHAQSSSRIHDISSVKSTVSTRGLERTALECPVVVIVPFRRAEELEEKYHKNRTNEACVLVRCISWHSCGVSSDVRVNFDVFLDFRWQNLQVSYRSCVVRVGQPSRAQS